MSASEQPKPQPVDNTAPQNAPQRDSIALAIRRNLNFGRIRSLAARGIACVRTRGWQALAREVEFRVDLMLHREVWKVRP